MAVQQSTDIRRIVTQAAADVKITDMHTHIYPPNFGDILLWGVDELVTYHYLVAETMRWKDMPYDEFWAMSKREQSSLIWQTLFLEHSPYSESCRGVLTSLSRLGLDTASRDPDAYRSFCEGFTVEEYVDKVFEVSGVECVVMTNDPFDDLERPSWLEERPIDPRFHAALRLDALLNTWDAACPRLREWGYNVEGDFGGRTFPEVRRFLKEWIDRMNPAYMAVSLPPLSGFGL